MWYFCWIFCVTILWYFCMGLLVAGSFIRFPLHMTMVWDLAIGSGNPGTERPQNVYVSKHQSALIGGDGDSRSPQGCRPGDIGHRAEERKPSFLALARKTTSEERRAKSEAICSWWEERTKRAMGGPRGYVAWNHTKLLMH